MSRQSELPPSKRTPSVRTERASKCVERAPIATDARTAEVSQNARQDAISRTEQGDSAALREPAPLDPEGTARVLTAALLDSLMRRHWQAREAWASNRCIADHYCENTESVVRRWRSGEKSIPLAALHVLPATLAEELARGVLKARGVDLRQSMGTLADAVEAIEGPVADVDREEVIAQLRDARDRIIAQLDRLTTAGDKR